MIERVVSGGQTGADQAAWRAAERARIATGGAMPRGFQTEDGPRPDLAGRFGAVEHESAEPSARTVANVRGSDGTLIFAGTDPGPGTRLTLHACDEAGRPCLVVDPDRPRPLAEVAAWVARHGIRTLNVAGDRESRRPGLGRWVEPYLAGLFRRQAIGPGAIRGPGRPGR